MAYEVSILVGINFSPIVSTVGPITNVGSGVIKISPDRRKIAKMNEVFTSRADLYDFDPNTGIVSNYLQLNTYQGDYGAEFSSDNTKLYILNYDGHGLLQYDIITGY